MVGGAPAALNFADDKGWDTATVRSKMFMSDTNTISFLVLSPDCDSLLRLFIYVSSKRLR